MIGSPKIRRRKEAKRTRREETIRRAKTSIGVKRSWRLKIERIRGEEVERARRVETKRERVGR